MPAPAGKLDPDLARRVSNLQLRVRRAIDGVMSGSHRSPHRGASVVFVEHQEYRPGDDLRRIDWRASARRDRHVLKRFEQESSLRAWLLVDTSGSMHYRGERADVSKFEHAATLASAMAHLLLRQSDAVSLVTADSQIRELLPSRSTASQLDAVLEVLGDVHPTRERTDLARVFNDIIERVGRRGLLVVFSDLIDVPDTTLDALHHFIARGHEVWLAHVLSREELELPFSGAVRFSGSEHEDLLDVDVDSARAAYREVLDEWLRQTAAHAAAIGARYVLAPTDVAAEHTLAGLLDFRRGTRAKANVG